MVLYIPFWLLLVGIKYCLFILLGFEKVLLNKGIDAYTVKCFVYAKEIVFSVLRDKTK